MKQMLRRQGKFQCFVLILSLIGELCFQKTSYINRDAEAPAPLNNTDFTLQQRMLTHFIIHQTHYEKSDWSRAFNQFTIACELDMINVIFAADIAFIMSSSTSAWLPSPLGCSPQKQNG